MQKEFAQNSIRWRVADAKAAGIHPLYALGASSASFSPIQGYGGDYGISDAFNTFSQGIDRAAQAKMTREERDRLQANEEINQTFQLAMMDRAARLEDSKINLMESEVLRNKIAFMVALRNASRVPSMPSFSTGIDGSVISGQGDSYPSVSGQGSIIDVKPSEREANAPGSPGASAASIPDHSFVAAGDGGYAMVRSSDIADRLDDDLVGNILWNLRNYGNAYFDNPKYAPPKAWLPKGASYWVFNSGRGEWYPNTHGYGYNANPFSSVKFDFFDRFFNF